MTQEEIIRMTRQCPDCGEVNPAEIHTCSPQIKKPTQGGLKSRYHELQFANYTAQPQGEWVDLTDDEKYDLNEKYHTSDGKPIRRGYDDAIVAKFKEKNTAPVVSQGEPVAFMFKVKRTTKAITVLDEFAAIEYFPQDNEEIISKEPLSYAAPVQREQQEPVAWALMHKNGLEFNTGYGMVETLQQAKDMQRRHLGNLKIVSLYTTPPSVEAAVLAERNKFTAVGEVKDGSFGGFVWNEGITSDEAPDGAVLYVRSVK